MICIFYFLIFSLCSSNIYGLYELSEECTYTYDVVFQGNVSLEASFLSHTHNDVQFAFSYTLIPQEYNPQNQSTFKIQISETKDLGGTHPIFVYFLNSLLLGMNKQIAYGIQSPNDDIVVFDMQSKKHALSFLMGLFFPKINVEDGYAIQQYDFPLLYDLGNTKTSAELTVEVEGWNFFTSNRKTTDPYPLLENNHSFIKSLIKKYTKLNKNNKSHVFWMQRFEVMVSGEEYGHIVDSSFLGVYSVDRVNKKMQEATIDADMTAKVNYQYQFITVPLGISLRGLFSINLRAR